MNKSDLAHTLIDVAVREKVFYSQQKLRFRLESFFHGLTLQQKRVLDIGGGDGLFSFYAACLGAEEVVCLEPEAAGSTPGVVASFQKLQQHLPIGDRVKLEPVTFQQYATTAKRFDVILLYNSINHLDETACIHLAQDQTAQERYLGIFASLYRLSNPGARLILADCSRHNFFAHLGARNPFCPMIEWHKHQSPNLWIELLSQVGFCHPRVIWLSLSTFGNVGRWFLGNRLAAYCINSHFRLEMRRPAS